MKTKKWLALVLAMVMVLSLLAGCGGKGDTPPEPAPAPAPAAPENSDPAAPETPAPADGPSWKQDTSDCTVTWFMAYDWYGKKFDETNNLFDKKLYEETGVKIDIQTGDTDKLNMLIQTG